MRAWRPRRLAARLPRPRKGGALPGGGGEPTVAMTANAFAEDRQRCIEAGMNDFLAKPVEPERLYATLLRILAGAEGVAYSA